MPIEIRELMIKVRVEDQPAAASPVKAGAAGKSFSEKDLQRIIATCTEQVLKILQQQKEK